MNHTENQPPAIGRAKTRKELEEYVLFLETEDKSTFDYSTLITYSRLCADDYGPYIHLARGLVYPVTDEYFDQYDDCASVAIAPLVGTSGTANLGTLTYPNPSTGWATVRFVNESSGRIEVVDVSGNIGVCCGTCCRQTN